MSEHNRSKISPLEKVAAFIVDKRKAFYFVYILSIIFSMFSMNWVSVNNNITDYLSEETETRRGITLMEDEFITYASAEVMIDNISYSDAKNLCEELEEIEGVKDIAFDNTESHYKNASALFSVTFDGKNDDEICLKALEEIEDKTKYYDVYVSAELGNSKAETTAKEINNVLVIACIIILTVLLISSRTYMEIPVLVITFGAAAILNKGTNYIFGEISFISNSIAVVLQLALAIDYAIILCHRYTEEREKREPREAVIKALYKSIPEISGSCLTTVSGLAAMSFMQFKVGFDMSIVLIKAIAISIICVFTLMPGLLMTFSKVIDRTRHRNFIPNITAWSNAIIKIRYITPPIFALVITAAFFISSNCPYAYSYTNLTTITRNESQIAQEMITDTFGQNNMLAVLVPSGEYDKEQALKEELEKYPQVDTVTGLASVEAIDGYAIGDKLTPREFAELTDMDIEMVRLIYSAYAVEEGSYGRIISGIDTYKIALLDMFDFVYDMTENGYVSLNDEMQKSLDELHTMLDEGKSQLSSENTTRIVMNLNIPEESEESFEFLNEVRDTAKKYYGDDVLLVGNTTSDYDLSTAFVKDNLIITILSVLFVLIVLFFTFQSAGIPIILILVIQGSIWINFSFPTIQNQPIFFMGYLVVSAIQMGANIDYAIVITSRYTEFRREMNKFDAIKKALNLAFPTIFTSGTILASAGYVIGLLSSDPAISSIGIVLGRGTVISILLVMAILPQLLILGDYIIEKTSFDLKYIREDIKERIKTGGGTDEK